MSTSIKVEDTLNEIRYAEGYNSDLPIVTTSTITASNIVTSATGTAGSFAVNGALTVTAAATIAGTLDVTGAASFNAAVNVTAAAGGLTFGSAGPTIQVGTNPNSGVQGPTGISATTGSLFINQTPTGPSNRLFVNAGATAWSSVTVAA